MLSVLLCLRGRNWSERAPDSKMLPEPDYFPEFPFPASLRKCLTIFEDVFQFTGVICEQIFLPYALRFGP